jgi:hypothetical protein
LVIQTANNLPLPVTIPFLDWRFQPQLDQPKHCAVRDATSYRFEEVVSVAKALPVNFWQSRQWHTVALVESASAV